MNYTNDLLKLTNFVFLPLIIFCFNKYFNKDKNLEFKTHDEFSIIISLGVIINDFIYGDSNNLKVIAEC